MWRPGAELEQFRPLISALRIAGLAAEHITVAMNQLKAVLLGVDPVLRESLSGLRNPALIDRCADLDDTGDAAAFTLRLLARRVQHLTAEAKELTRRVTRAVRTHRPQLLEVVGIGPDSAAALLIAADDNPERVVSEASFAALCGASPVGGAAEAMGRR